MKKMLTKKKYYVILYLDEGSACPISELVNRNISFDILRSVI